MLWKQDVDLGYSLTPFVGESPQLAANQTEDDSEKLKALQEIKDGKVRILVAIIIYFTFKQRCFIDSWAMQTDGKDAIDELDEWAGIQFTIDNETGKFILHVVLFL